MTGTANGVGDQCVICGVNTRGGLSSDFEGFHYQTCPRCGEFKVSITALAILRQGLSKEKRAIISGLVRDQNRVAAKPAITSDNLKLILSRPLPSVSDRAMKLLKEAAHGQTGLRIQFNVSDPRFMAATYSAEKDDLNILMEMLDKENLIEKIDVEGNARILPDGLIQLDELKRESSARSQGFVAMWFDESLNEVYRNGFKKGISKAGYTPFRVDQAQHIDRIDDKIIAEIKTSKFVVADFTGHRGGVYFEAGYALGLNIPVFWTCQKDHMKDLHFDVSHYNCISWDCPDDLAERLSIRIEAVVGLGPGKAFDYIEWDSSDDQAARLSERVMAAIGSGAEAFE